MKKLNAKNAVKTQRAQRDSGDILREPLRELHLCGKIYA